MRGGRHAGLSATTKLLRDDWGLELERRPRAGWLARRQGDQARDHGRGGSRSRHRLRPSWWGPRRSPSSRRPASGSHAPASSFARRGRASVGRRSRTPAVDRSADGSGGWRGSMPLAQSRWRFDRMVGAPFDSRFGLASSVDGCSARRFAGRRRDRWRDRRGLGGGRAGRGGSAGGARRTCGDRVGRVGAELRRRPASVRSGPDRPPPRDGRAVPDAGGGEWRNVHVRCGTGRDALREPRHRDRPTDRRRTPTESSRTRRTGPRAGSCAARSSRPSGPTWPPVGWRSAIRSSPPPRPGRTPTLAVTRGVEIRLGIERGARHRRRSGRRGPPRRRHPHRGVGRGRGGRAVEPVARRSVGPVAADPSDLGCRRVGDACRTAAPCARRGGDRHRA